MLRGRLLIVSLLVACGSNASAPPPAEGPTFTPLLANQLRAIAPDCAITRAADEVRTCKGARANVTITLDAKQRLRALDIDLGSMFFPEAKIRIEQTLPGIVEVPEILARLEKLMPPEGRDEFTASQAKVTLAARGASRAAPEYSVHLRW